MKRLFNRDLFAQWTRCELTSDEIERATLLRALEWCTWPVFLCQPLLPVLYLFWPSYFILAVVIVLAWVWVPIANRYVSYGAATVGCLWVRLRVPTILVGTLYYSWKHAFYLALLTLATPLIVQLLIRLVPKADLVAIQRKMMAEIGFDPSQEELNRTVDRLKSGLKSMLD